jgi:hypothetical protein
MIRPFAPRARILGSVVAAIVVLIGTHLSAHADHARSPYAHEPPDTLFFTPAGPDSAETDSTRLIWVDEEAVETGEQEDELPLDRWSRPRIPYGDHILRDQGLRIGYRGGMNNVAFLFDYNRVDLFRGGFNFQFDDHDDNSSMPRFGATVEYAFGRTEWLYGLQLEQPLLDDRRLTAGVTMLRRTDHNILQQTSDWENSLALLFARQDYRDYFEREGYGGYLRSRALGFTTVSLHARQDRFRSLPLDTGTDSWFNQDIPLRDNPEIDEGEGHTVALRFQRQSRNPVRTRAGLTHWIEIEKAGGNLGGDFSYTRAFADLRGVLRLSPASEFAVRAIAGSTLDGTLPRQRGFALGGVDGLRAHNTATMKGNQALLLQAEYDLALWSLRRRNFRGGLHALVFVDAGKAWSNAGNGWDVGDQRLAVDGGFGIAGADDGFRVYFAQNLQDPRPDLNVSLRLQRAF